MRSLKDLIARRSAYSNKTTQMRLLNTTYFWQSCSLLPIKSIDKATNLQTLMRSLKWDHWKIGKLKRSASQMRTFNTTDFCQLWTLSTYQVQKLGNQSTCSNKITQMRSLKDLISKSAYWNKITQVRLLNTTDFWRLDPFYLLSPSIWQLTCILKDHSNGITERSDLSEICYSN